MSATMEDKAEKEKGKEGHKELFRSHRSKCRDFLGEGIEEISERTKKGREEEI